MELRLIKKCYFISNWKAADIYEIIIDGECVGYKFINDYEFRLCQNGQLTFPTFVWWELNATLPVIEECSRKFAESINDVRYDVLRKHYPGKTDEWIEQVQIPKIVKFIKERELVYENQTIS